MAWERGYYYRVRKQGGRVVREYVGAGPDAELVARLDALERERRQLERDDWRAEQARQGVLEARMADFCDLADLAAAVALLTSGCHKHKGQWRRKRHGNVNHAGDTDRPQGAGEDAAAR